MSGRTEPGLLAASVPRLLRPGGRSGAAPWAVAVGGAVLLGAAIGSGSSLAVLAIGGMVLAIGLALPLPWLVLGGAAAALGFRLVAPTSTGLGSFIPDALLALLLLRVGAMWAVGRTAGLRRWARAGALALAALIALAFVSALLSHDAPVALVGSLRQFARFPLWGLALLAVGLDVRTGRRLVGVVLAASLLQFPFALWQYRHTPPGLRFGIFYRGDNVTGTFGLGGSGVMMVFLVLALTIWLCLALERVVRVWWLGPVGVALVLPMAWGSAAFFLLLLPLAVAITLVRAALIRQVRIPASVLVGGALLVPLGLWAGATFGLAPGFAGSGQVTATQVLSDRYLSQYLTQPGTGPGSRVGFMKFAVQVDIRSGLRGVAVGQGPSASIIGAASQVERNDTLGGLSALTSKSVQSVQRLLLGYGFLAPLLLALALVLPGVRLPVSEAGDPVVRAVRLGLPAVMVVLLLAGPYNSAWADPGVAAAYWALVAVAAIGTAGRSEGERA
jgi:hypothetical protein